MTWGHLVVMSLGHQLQEILEFIGQFPFEIPVAGFSLI